MQHAEGWRYDFAIPTWHLRAIHFVGILCRENTRLKPMNDFLQTTFYVLLFFSIYGLWALCIVFAYYTNKWCDKEDEKERLLWKKRMENDDWDD